MPEEQRLSPEEIVMLIEALDELIPFSHHGSAWSGVDDPARWQPYRDLRARLKSAVGMGFHERGRSWLDHHLYKEREATLQNMLKVLFPALADPAMDRPKLKTLISEAFRKLKWERQYREYTIAEWDMAQAAKRQAGERD